MMDVKSEVIGETNDLVVVVEHADHWKGITVFTHAGSFSMDADDSASLIKRLKEARQKILK